MPTDSSQRTVRFLRRELGNGYANPKLAAVEVTLGNLGNYKASRLNKATKIICTNIIVPFLRKENQKNFEGIEKIVIGFKWPERPFSPRRDTFYMLGDYEIFCDKYYAATGGEVVRAGMHSFERHVGRIVNLELREVSQKLGYEEPNYGKVISNAYYKNSKNECELDVIAIANSNAIATLAGKLENYGMRPYDSVKKYYHPDLADAKADFSVLKIYDKLYGEPNS